MSLSSVVRDKTHFKFGRCDLFYYDSTLTKYILFGHTQDTTVEITWTEEELSGGQGDALLDTARKQARVNITSQLLEITTANLLRLLPSEFARISTGATLESYEEVVSLAGTAYTLMKFPAIAASPSPKVTSLDGSTVYVEESAPLADDNDYVVDRTLGKLKRTTVSTIPNPGTVKVQYEYLDAAASIVNVGSKSCTVSGATFTKLRGVSTGRKCEFDGFEVYKAKSQSPLTVPYTETFKVLNAKWQGITDDSLPPGFDLMRFIQGSAAQV